MRSHSLAICISCVTIIIVHPSFLNSLSSFITICLFSSSSDPVGSSAKINSHGLTNNLARAIRCCSPPEHS